MYLYGCKKIIIVIKHLCKRSYSVWRSYQGHPRRSKSSNWFEANLKKTASPFIMALLILSLVMVLASLMSGIGAQLLPSCDNLFEELSGEGFRVFANVLNPSSFSSIRQRDCISDQFQWVQHRYYRVCVYQDSMLKPAYSLIRLSFVPVSSSITELWLNIMLTSKFNIADNFIILINYWIICALAYSL